MTIDLTKEEQALLLEMLNEARVPGRIAKLVATLLEKLSAAPTASTP